MDNLEELRNEVRNWIKGNPNAGIFGPIPNRSCWNCNGAHEYLKLVDYPIDCFECDQIYYKGINITKD